MDGNRLALGSTKLPVEPDAQSRDLTLDEAIAIAILLQKSEQFAQAETLYQWIFDAAPDHPEALHYAGVLAQQRGRSDEAVMLMQRSLALEPGRADWHSNLGIAYQAQARVDEAIAAFSRAIEFDPEHPDARKLLALAHSTIGEVDEAIRIFEDWLIEEPANPIARHMLAACTGLDVPARASNAFVTDTFASFAASFEAKLARLSYRAPALVVAMLADARVAPSRDLDVLDAGCGTGLCGPLLAPYARRLWGMDLSAEMLAHAEDMAPRPGLEPGTYGLTVPEER